MPDSSAMVPLAASQELFVDMIPVGSMLRYVTNSLLIARSLSERTDADVIVIDGRTTLYTSLDGKARSRLVLRWK